MRGSDLFDDPLMMGMAGSFKISGSTTEKYIVEPDGTESLEIGKDRFPMLLRPKPPLTERLYCAVLCDFGKSCIPYLR